MSIAALVMKFESSIVLQCQLRRVPNAVAYFHSPVNGFSVCGLVDGDKICVPLLLSCLVLHCVKRNSSKDADMKLRSVTIKPLTYVVALIYATFKLLLTIFLKFLLENLLLKIFSSSFVKENIVMLIFSRTCQYERRDSPNIAKAVSKVWHS